MKEFLSDLECLERWRDRLLVQKLLSKIWWFWGFSPQKECGIKISIAEQSKLEHSGSNAKEWCKSAERFGLASGYEKSIIKT
jgi:hypothetical protein